jgi:phosphoglucomutase
LPASRYARSSLPPRATTFRSGGIKVIAENGWFAARSSGTEDIYKIYAESFRSEDHLRQIQQEAQDTIARVFEKAKV